MSLSFLSFLLSLYYYCYCFLLLPVSLNITTVIINIVIIIFIVIIIIIIISISIKSAILCIMIEIEATGMFSCITYNSPVFIENLFTLSDASYNWCGEKNRVPTSWHRNAFRITVFLWGESIGNWCFPPNKDSVILCCLSLSRLLNKQACYMWYTPCVASL